MPRLLTWLLRLLPIIGLALVVVGSREWYPEGWLDSKGFVINLASSAAAACFGVPVAFFVLQSLLGERQGAERRKRARDRASKALSVLETAVGVVFPDIPDEDAIKRIFNDLADARSKFDREIARARSRNEGNLSEEDILLAASYVVMSRAAEHLKNSNPITPYETKQRVINAISYMRTLNVDRASNDLPLIPEMSLTTIDTALQTDLLTHSAARTRCMELEAAIARLQDARAEEAYDQMVRITPYLNEQFKSGRERVPFSEVVAASESTQRSQDMGAVGTFETARERGEAVDAVTQDLLDYVDYYWKAFSALKAIAFVIRISTD